MSSKIGDAAAAVEAFHGGALTQRIRLLEKAFSGASRQRARVLCGREGVDAKLLGAAFHLKDVAAQIHTLIHAVGILAALPKVLRGDEKVESLSLGAGNTGRKFDLETDRQVAEFKFIRWRGGSETIRQNSIFKDFFNLAEARTPKARRLYVLGTEQPLAFLQGRRKLSSVMSKNAKVSSDFEALYEDRFTVVREYFALRHGRVEIVDLLPIVPELHDLPAVDS